MGFSLTSSGLELGQFFGNDGGNPIAADENIDDIIEKKDVDGEVDGELNIVLLVLLIRRLFRLVDSSLVLLCNGDTASN